MDGAVGKELLETEEVEMVDLWVLRVWAGADVGAGCGIPKVFARTRGDGSSIFWSDSRLNLSPPEEEEEDELIDETDLIREICRCLSMLSRRLALDELLRAVFGAEVLLRVLLLDRLGKYSVKWFGGGVVGGVKTSSR